MLTNGETNEYINNEKSKGLSMKKLALIAALWP
jgi:hypothetical protein